MTTRGRLHDWVHRYPVAMDALLTLLVLAGVLFAGSTPNEHKFVALRFQPWPAVLLEILVVLALMLRRTKPVTVLVVAVLGAATVMLISKSWSPVAVAAIVAIFSLSRRIDRRPAVLLALVCGPTLIVGGAWRTGNWLSTESISLLAWTGFAAALGQAIKSQKAYVQAVEERALRAEQTREEEAGRRVIEERMRIARELHDVVAHHIAVIQVQAGVVDHLLTEQPTAAREALGHVRRSSKMVLDELSGMLNVLRQADEPITPTDPAPGMDRLVTLIEQFAASGLKVDWRFTGTPLTLPAAIDVVTYRLVQEGLTNAHKHGTGSVDMVLDFKPTELMIDIVNQIAGTAVGSGHGLAGMRERAHAVGGVVSAAPQGQGTWRVTARMPLVAELADPWYCR
ncbi:MAG TPA: histidine kinase [Kineosporiaceae bacterium]|nr:histidine kinase [Kineosporiaceae bacterium]